MKKKKIFKIISLLLFFIILMLIFLFLFSKEDKNKIKTDKVEIKQGNIAYVLCSKNGQIFAYNHKDKEVSKVSVLKKSFVREDDFIYAVDEGNIYAESIKDKNDFVSIIYALNKRTGNIYLIKVDGDNLALTDKSTSLKKAKEATELKAYNGQVHFLTKGERTSSETCKTLKLTAVGIDNNASMLLEKRSKLRSYVHVFDFSNEYLEITGLKNKLNEDELKSIIIPNEEYQIFEFTGDVDTFNISGRYIYFFMGNLEGVLDKNKKTMHIKYGLSRTKASVYIDGRFKKLWNVGDFGETSQKTLIYKEDARYGNAMSLYAIDGAGLPVSIHNLDDEYLFVTMKLTNSDEDSTQSLRNICKIDCESGNVVSLKNIPYAPLDILAVKNSSNGLDTNVYLFNPFSTHYLKLHANLTEDKYIEYPKLKDGDNIVKALKINYDRKDLYLYKDGKFVNEDGKRISANNEVLDEKGNRYNKYGQKINENGLAVNDDGEFIDRFGNVLNETGVIKKYVKGKDGHYRNKNGDIVNKDGEILYKVDDSYKTMDEIKTGEVSDKIRGYFDESGNFVTDNKGKVTITRNELLDE